MASSSISPPEESPRILRYWDLFQSFTEYAIDYFKADARHEMSLERFTWLQAFYTILYYTIHLHTNWNNEETAKLKTIEYVGEKDFNNAISIIPPKKGNPQFYFIHTLVIFYWKHIHQNTSVLHDSRDLPRLEFTYIVATDFISASLNEVIYLFEGGVRVKDGYYYINNTDFPELWDILQDWSSGRTSRTHKKLAKLFNVKKILKRHS
jgi:hypothetical protein